MSLYVGGKKYNITMAKWRGFWSVTIHGFPGTIIDCGYQKVIGDDGKVTFKFAESDTYTFIAMRGDKTEVLEVELVDGEYFVEKHMYVGIRKLEYIESTGIQYIDTNILSSNYSSIKVKLRARKTSTTASKEILVGTFSDWNGSWLGFLNNKWTSDEYTSSEFDASVVQNIEWDTYNIKSGAPRSTIKVDDKTWSYSRSSRPSGTYGNIQIFHTPNLSGYYSQAQIYGEVEIYGDNNLLAMLIPVIDNNNVVCMYDQVTEQFFYNQGTGDFIAGPVKE